MMVDQLHADTLYAARCWEEAAQALQGVLAAQPGNLEARFKLGFALYSLGRLAPALNCAEHVLRAAPDNVDALILHGSILSGLDRFTESLASFARAVQLEPGSSNAASNYGAVLHRLERIDEAMAWSRRALELDPANAIAHKNLGWLQHVTNDNLGALKSYAAAERLVPGDPEILFYRGMTELRLGKFAQGWKHYAARWKLPAMQSGKPRRSPEWDGKAPLRGKRIMLVGEQGIGDTLQFLRFVPRVRELKADVTVRLPARLVSLAARSLPGIDILPDDVAEPEADLHSYLMSLPMHLGIRVDGLAETVPYLRADPVRVQAWRKRLGRRGTRNIGFAWSGNPRYGQNAARSLPQEAVRQLLGVGRRFVCMQSPISAAERELLSQFKNAIYVGDDVTDPDDLAALVEALDQVICVDTSFAHIAGALNKPLWIVLSHSPDWRWMLDRDDSPWYPSARLFRQARPNDWSSATAPVVAALQGRSRK